MEKHEEQKIKRNGVAILGGILFLLMFFLNGGVYRLLYWSPGIINATEWGDRLAALFFLIIGSGLIWYGFKSKKQKDK